MQALKGETILLRADANPSLGIGHVMRCLALADALQEVGAYPVLWSLDIQEPIAALYEERAIPIVQDTAADIAWLVIDHPNLEASAPAKRTIVIDDMAIKRPEGCDLLINPNPGRVALGPGVLAGADYVLLRRDVLNAPRTSGRAGRNVLVSCGGTDPFEAAPDVLEALRGLDVTIRLLGGVAKTYSRDVDCIAADFNIAQHFAWADMAIVVAGTVQWEAAYLGCPFIALSVVDAQLPGAQAFADAGGSVHFDWTAHRDLKGLGQATQRFLRGAGPHPARLIDGQGGARIVRAMAQMV